MSFDEKFDVIVIGAGHAGCEAAAAAARMGAETVMVTLNLDLIGQMSCNPAIGGIAKGHIVREIDALGGIMGRVIDRTGIQFRLLNRSRGPAVQSPRAQADRALYRTEMRQTLEMIPNLHLRQGHVIDLIVENGRVRGVEMQDTRRICADAVILATGTFLNGLIHTGKRTYTAGRAGEPASLELAECLKRLGFSVGRLKTGTPPRLDARTIDWEKFEVQPTDESPVPFSFSTETLPQPQINCFIGYTNETVHDAIRANIHESPLYSGQIKGIGPRYCPSIEDKVVKFPDKTRHQIFLEPEGHNTAEVYMNGFSTSLPADLQQQFVRKIPGLEETQIIRPGYAIEYDFVDPRSLTPFLETMQIKGLFFAGQINGTTGYEEAACQGLLAGINAALSVKNHEGFSLRRGESYIGVLINDLVTHGVDEPYRMFTSRAENRLSLRYDTADARLTIYGRDLGLVDDTDWELFNTRRNRLSHIRRIFETSQYKRSDTMYQAVSHLLRTELGDSFTFAQLALRPQTDLELLRKVFSDTTGLDFSAADFNTVYADVLYKGYLKLQQDNYERIHHHDHLAIPLNFNYRNITGLSTEMVERFEKARPMTFGQVRSLPGITSAAVTTLLVHLKLYKAA